MNETSRIISKSAKNSSLILIIFYSNVTTLTTSTNIVNQNS